MKPVIGVMAHLKTDMGPLGHSHTGNTYIESINKVGGIPVMIPTMLNGEEDMEQLIDQLDGFLFTGGIDVCPSFYGAESHRLLGKSDSRLDKLQIPFAQKVIAARKPVLGICRGHQVLNVACGGTLYQDLSEIEGVQLKHFQDAGYGDIAHKVTIEPDTILSRLYEDRQIWVNSFHHQAVKDFGKNIRLAATSSDGVVEAIEIEDYPFGLGLQWHPESMFGVGVESMRPIFEAFVNACR